MLTTANGDRAKMEPSSSAQAQVCICRRTFASHGALRFHQRTCQQGKKRTSSVLNAAKEKWESRKKRKLASRQDALDVGGGIFWI